MIRNTNISLACLLLLSTGANSVELGDVVVTATKTERKLSDVPASVVVITKDDISNSSANSVDELLWYQAGIDVVHNIGILSTGSTNKVIIRGVGGTGESRTLLLVDGVPMNGAFSGSVEWSQIPLKSIERIEIVKGASSSLYGSNAMGGVVNIITKNPEKQNTSISLNYGSMDTKIASFLTSGKIDNFGYLVSGQITKSDGYVGQLPEDIEDNTIKTGLDRKNSFVKLYYEVDDSSQVGFSHSYYKNEILGELDIPTGYNSGIDTMRMLQISYSKHFRNNSGLKITLFNKTNDSTNDYLKNPTTVEYHNGSNSDEAGGSLQYTYPLHSHIFTMGLDLQKADVQSYDNYVKGDRVDAYGKQDYYGVYLQDEIYITDEIILNLGGRFDEYKNHDGQINDEVSGSYVAYPSRRMSAFSPKIALVYNMTPQTAFKTSIGKAFKAPSVNDLYKHTVKKDKISAGNPNLDPETITSIEASIIHQLSQKDTFTLTGYHSIIKDYIYSLVAPASSPYYKEKINVGEAKITGVEAQLDYAIASKWNVLLNYTYNKATIEKFDKDISLEGKDIIRVPRHKASIGIEYKNPSLFDLMINGRYVGSRYEDDKNEKEYDSYIIYDLKISKQINENLATSLSINDIFDEGYSEKYLSPGRVVMANFSLSF